MTEKASVSDSFSLTERKTGGRGKWNSIVNIFLVSTLQNEFHFLFPANLQLSTHINIVMERGLSNDDKKQFISIFFSVIAWAFRVRKIFRSSIFIAIFCLCALFSLTLLHSEREQNNSEASLSLAKRGGKCWKLIKFLILTSRKAHPEQAEKMLSSWNFSPSEEASAKKIFEEFSSLEN